MKVLSTTTNGSIYVAIYGHVVLLPPKPSVIEDFAAPRILAVESETIKAGGWFLIHGVPEYFTPLAYFFFKHWTIDGKPPEFSEELNADFLVRWSLDPYLKPKGL